MAVTDWSQRKDAEIGRAVSEVISHGNNAEVKRDREGDILVLDVNNH